MPKKSTSKSKSISKSKSKSMVTHMETDRSHRSEDPIDVPECAICLCPLDPESDGSTATTIRLGCKHHFHRACLHKWTSEIADPADYYVQQNAKPCPTCRRELGAAKLGEVGFFDTPPDAPEWEWMWGGSGDERLSWAARQGDASTVRRLLTNGHPMGDPFTNPFAPDDNDDGRGPPIWLCDPMLEAIAFEGKPAVVLTFLEVDQELGGYGRISEQLEASIKTGLLEAARRGNAELVELFMDHGVQLDDPDRDEEDEEAPLHAAAEAGKIDMVDLLLDNDADIEATWYRFGLEACEAGTALMVACHSGHLEVARRLLERGADPSHYDDGDYGPLECAVKQFIANDDSDAARKKTRQLELVRLLCSDPRIDMAHQNERGKTVLEGLRTFYGGGSAHLVDPMHVAALEAVLTAERRVW